MNRGTVITCIVCLIIGLAAGRLSVAVEKNKGAWGRGLQASHVGREHLAQSQKYFKGAHSDEDVAALAGLSGLSDTVESGPLVVVPAAFIQSLRGEHARRTIGHDLFSQDGASEADLQIADREKALVQQAWRQFKQSLHSLERNLAKAEDLEDGSVRITVPDYRQEIVAIANGFRWQTSNVLGVNRAEAFLAMKQFDMMLSQLAGEQVFLVEMDATGNGEWRYRIQQKREDRIASTIVTRTIPHSIRHLTDHVGIQAQLDQIAEEAEF